MVSLCAQSVFLPNTAHDRQAVCSVRWYDQGMKPRLFIQQKITPFANQYKVFGAGEAGELGDIIAFAQQKRLAFKEKVMFYTDENKSSEVFSFRAEKVLDIHGRYIVEDTGGVIGFFKKEFKQSLLASTWRVFREDDRELFVVKESSTALALFRRYGDFIPIIGGIIELITMLFKYHFVITDVESGEIVGTYRKTTLFRDHYTLHLTDEAHEKADWRLLAGLSVGLDALQSR